MISIVSPAKSLDFNNKAPVSDFSLPLFLEESQKIVNVLKDYSPEELSKLMNISKDLGLLNANRYQDYNTPFKLENAKQAIFAFTGDVYDGLDAPTLETSDQAYAQDHLRILSGLYGILRPLDLIQAYRLEMGRPLKTKHASNLYVFWRESIGSHLKQATDAPLINLASQEYFKAVPQQELPNEIISPVFKDEKNGTFKITLFTYRIC